MKRPILTVFVILIALAAAAQRITPQVFNSGGGSYINNGHYVRYFDWSIGELALINTVATPDSTILVTQGFLQAGTEKPGFTPFYRDFRPEDYKLFPNPTSGKFEINFFLNDQGTLDLELTDAAGRILNRRSFPYGLRTRIVQYDISHLPAGVYFITATLRPDPFSEFNIGQQPRRSGLPVIKVNE